MKCSLILDLSMTKLKPCNFDEPRYGTQSHYNCERMEANDITFSYISNPPHKRTNHKCYVARQKHKETIARRESKTDIFLKIKLISK